MLFLVSTFGEGFEEYNYLQFCVDPGVNNLLKVFPERLEY